MEQLPHSSETWEVRTARKRESCASAIPEAWRLPPSIWEDLKLPLEQSKNDLVELKIVERSNILSPKELEITEAYDVPNLLRKLAAGFLTAVEVTTAFSKRAAIAQQLTQCLTETLFDQALERAQHLDGLREKGQLAGPLHGLPVSLKDGYQVTGVPATLGLVAFLDNVSTTNSCVVDVLLELGAVLYVKTNIPQVLMTADSHNNVFGRTLNPRNTMVTAGGSSGGEGALIALRGSPLGVGTDIAGSMRVPALCCGTYGFKPTVGRVPYGRQVHFSNPNVQTISAVGGPFANDIAALKIFMSAIINARPARHDSTVFDLPWRSNLELKPKLRFGVLPEDTRFPLHPPVKKTLSEAATLLEAQGHEIVFPREDECHIAEAFENAWYGLAMDPTASQLVTNSGEPDVPSRLGLRKEWMRLGQKYTGGLNAMSPIEKWSALVGKRAEIVERWHKLWNKYGLDAVIAPGAQNTAVEHDLYNAPPYTALLNLLDYPACIIPFGEASQPSLNEEFELREDQSAPPYHPDILAGLPCAIQLFTYRMRDEECLEIAGVVDACLHAR